MKNNFINKFPDIKNSKHYLGGATTILRLIDDIVDSINIRTPELPKIAINDDNDIINIKEKLLTIYSKRIKESQDNNKNNNKNDDKENKNDVKENKNDVKESKNLQNNDIIKKPDLLTQRRKSIGNPPTLQRRKSISNKKNM
jgi:hypothetical protein